MRKGLHMCPEEVGVETARSAATLWRLLALLCFDHLPQLRLMLLSTLQSNLAPYKHELRHFFDGFLAEWGLVKRRQLFELLLGALVGIGEDRLLLHAVPMEIFVQKPLHDLSLRSELRIVLELAFQDLLCQLRHVLIDSHDEEEVLSSLPMTCFIAHRHGRGEQHSHCHQAPGKHRSHHTVRFLPYGQRVHAEEGPLRLHPP
jgi:hypothetical protein